ncbi:MAG: ARMT1-like domain-containing protein [Deltaproteobacteria bacterium]|nr:ARMT1-like domain-containing protein [Deltaproteobacteria bacterium]
MRNLESDPRCRDCLRDLAGKAVRLALGAETSRGAEMKKRALELLDRGLAHGQSSPVIANSMLREITRMSGTRDPYEAFKVKELESARSVFSSITEVGQDLRSRLSLAVLGNTLDFFRDPEKVLDEIPALLRAGIRFDRDDIDRLERFLDERPRRILYLTDNTGELYFDLPLYEALSERSKQCTLVLKGGPSLNDLTREELRLSGLAERFSEVADTGTEGAGIDWQRVSSGFRARVRGADLIISKGMANFETVYPEPLPASSFYLFRVKCEPIQDMAGIPVGGFGALWKDGDREGTT